MLIINLFCSRFPERIGLLELFMAYNVNYCPYCENSRKLCLYKLFGNCIEAGEYNKKGRGCVIQ